MGAPSLSLQLCPLQCSAVPWLKPEGETRGEDFMGVRRWRETSGERREPGPGRRQGGVRKAGRPPDFRALAARCRSCCWVDGTSDNGKTRRQDLPTPTPNLRCL